MLRFASEDLQANPKVVMEAVMVAVKQNGRALKYASKDLQNNLVVVMAAVKQDGMALGCASNALQTNPKVVRRP